MVKAYTTLEVVVVLAIFFVISLLIFPFALGQIQGSKIEYEVRVLKSAMTSQQMNAYSNLNDSSYGIAFFNDHYFLYSGESLATATTSTRYDISSEINLTNINFSNLGSELNFAKETFRPNTVGSVSLVSNNITFTITINSEGLITYIKS